MHRIKNIIILDKYLPEGSGYLVSAWLNLHPVNVRISGPRQSKLGDFRPPSAGRQARISVNHNLHPVEFLVTLAHEIAHHENWLANGRKVRPHGPEWKKLFRDKLLEVLDAGLLEKKFEDGIKLCFFRREGIASSSCPAWRRLFDQQGPEPGKTRIEDLPMGAVFVLRNGKSMIKGEKIRTRYRCMDVKSRRIYTVHPMAEIIEIKPKKIKK